MEGSMAKAFASQGDIEEKKATFAELADGVYAYTTEGDPNTGIIVGDDGVLVMDTRATPVAAQELIDAVRTVTDKPFKYVVLSHYHAVRVLGASAYGAEHIVSSEMTRDLIVERGQQDYDSELARFPRLFQNAESIPGLTWPTLTFPDRMTIHMGSREVQLMHIGKGHTKGDIIAWLPEEKICFAGDLVEYGATPYAGDAYPTEWPETLEKLRAFGAEKMVPGRGDALLNPAQVNEAIDQTKAFVSSLAQSAADSAAKDLDLKQAFEAARDALAPRFGDWVIFEHCLPFDVSRAVDEAKGIVDPRIWTDQRDREMWEALQD
jgi:glyoxylase-like metal-dependent hydrolase (beta-lactamase superfamily II)